MIKCVSFGTWGFAGALYGMRLAFQSNDKSDSDLTDSTHVFVGPNDLALAKKLARAGHDSHSKYLRMIHTQILITAPLYFWKELDQYKIATTTNSESTMHTIQKYPFTADQFSCENLHENCTTWSDTDHKWSSTRKIFNYILEGLNWAREQYLKTKNKVWWWQMIQLLPSSWNQTRMWDGDYQTLHNIYVNRNNHPLTEWREFRKFIGTLPYSELFMYGGTDR